MIEGNERVNEEERGLTAVNPDKSWHVRNLDIAVGDWILAGRVGEYVRRVRFLPDESGSFQPGRMQVSSLDGEYLYNPQDVYSLASSRPEIRDCIGFVWMPTLKQFHDGTWYGADSENTRIGVFVMMRPERYLSELGSAGTFGTEDKTEAGDLGLIPPAELWLQWNVRYGGPAIWDSWDARGEQRDTKTSESESTSRGL